VYAKAENTGAIFAGNESEGAYQHAMDYQPLINLVANVAGHVLYGATTKSMVISEITADRFITGFLSNIRKPQIAVFDTTLSADEAMIRFQGMMSAYKAKEPYRTATSDGWTLLWSQKEPGYVTLKIGADVSPHGLLLMVHPQSVRGTRVAVGCRYLYDNTADWFKRYDESAQVKIIQMAQLLEPDSDLLFLNPQNSQGAIDRPIGSS
jgi:hypothetical protein